MDVHVPRFPDVPSSLSSRLPGLLPGSAGAPVDLGEQDPSAPRTSEGLASLSEAERGRRYVSQGVIGRGGMGDIHRVLDTDLRRALAMKVLRPQTPDERDLDAAALARFLEEAQITGQLDHPGIVPLHELGIDAEGRVYFTMRLVRGQHLGAVFEKARASQDGWSLERAVEALVKVADALAFAHAKGVVHRDLKPENVMAGRFGEVYVMDWGLAKVAGRDAAAPGRPATATQSRVDLRRDLVGGSGTLAGTICGTPAYMAPEQALGEVERVDARSDVYAFGSILYELLAGHPPYLWKGAEVDALRVVLAKRAGPPPAVRAVAPDAPADLAAICQKAMAHEPAQRYADMRAVAEDLRAWLAGRPVSALPLGPLARTLRWCRRSPWAAAALLAITVGAGFGLWSLAALTDELGLRAARDAAAREAAALDEVSRLYASAVIPVVRQAEAELGRPLVNDDLRHPTGTVPLPATFLTTLAERITGRDPAAEVRHYSDDPFRPRPEPDAFGRRALAELRRSPDTPVETVDDLDGRAVLRYATSRRMTEQACVACHNGHAELKKTDWRLGDVRGVLEILQPLDGHRARAREGVSGRLAIVGLLIAGLTLLAGLALLRSARRA